MGRSSRSGVLIKGGVYLEELRRLRAVALDKTGTLTRGKPELTELHPTGTLTDDELLALAAAAERRSEYPTARATVTAATGGAAGRARGWQYGKIPVVAGSLKKQNNIKT